MTVKFAEVYPDVSSKLPCRFKDFFENEDALKFSVRTSWAPG
jgi:hypothetical protein